MGGTLVVLVSGRGALAGLAGVPSVERHVKAGRRLGLDVIVVYPPERLALGTEIGGIVEADARCIPADEFIHESENGSDDLLVLAAEWYLSLTTITALRESPATRVFGRVCERGLVSVPIARVTREEAAWVAFRLTSASAAVSLASLLEDDSTTVEIDPRSEQRLSDNVSTTHAEEKLVEALFGPQRVLPVLRIRPVLAPVLARWFNRLAFGPAAISALKLLVGLAAAWILEGGSYAMGVAGAFLYLGARVIGASGIVLARAGITDDDVREKLDLAGDTVLHIALLWSLAGGAARGSGGAWLAAFATVGVLVSTGVAYVYVLRGFRGPATSDARVAARRRDPAAGDEFVSRFVQRDGIAYALVFAALTGSLDLFLWAAALASHLFYVLWLLARPRGESGAMPLSSAA